METNDFSYNPNDPLFEVPNFPNVSWGIQIFTLQNLYGLDPTKVQHESTDSTLHLVCSGLSWAGQQQRAEGQVQVQLEWPDDFII